MIKFDLNDTGLREYPPRQKKHLILKGVKKLGLKLAHSQKVRDYAKAKFYTEHTTEKLGDDIYRLKRGALFNSYLIVGKEKAALIDTGFGISGLRNMAEKITDKPLLVVASHSHIGATGGAGEFPEVKIHKADLRAAKAYNNVFIKKVLFNLAPVKYTEKLDSSCLVNEKGSFVPFTKKELKKGLDLGGRVIRIINCPSHTRGSCYFIDSLTGSAFIGDIISPLGITVLPGAVTLTAYSENLEKASRDFTDGKTYSSYDFKPLKSERVNAFKDLISENSLYGNDYTRFIKLRISDDKRQSLIFYPAKTIRRNLRTRIKYYKL